MVLPPRGVDIHECIHTVHPHHDPHPEHGLQPIHIAHLTSSHRVPLELGFTRGSFRRKSRGTLTFWYLGFLSKMGCFRKKIGFFSGCFSFVKSIPSPAGGIFVFKNISKSIPKFFSSSWEWVTVPVDCRCVRPAELV